MLASIFHLILCSIISYYVIYRHDVTPITMALNGAASNPKACGALSSMLSRNTLNPADITVLFKNYSAPDPPPMELIRTPQFLGETATIFVKGILTDD